MKAICRIASSKSSDQKPSRNHCSSAFYARAFFEDCTKLKIFSEFSHLYDDYIFQIECIFHGFLQKYPTLKDATTYFVNGT